MVELEILYIDNDVVVINKPHGLLVHRSPIASDVSEFAVQLLRDQIGKKVYPVHRLDRKTSGVLIFTLSKESLQTMSKAFADHEVYKTYMAIVRGYTDDVGEIDYPLLNEKGKIQEAFTEYKTIARVEMDFTIGKHPTSRYSFVKIVPQTGRMHQIRKHFAHIHHPIIGDRPHGCNKQNRYFKEQLLMDTMLLHASEVDCKHPVHEARINVAANYFSEFDRIITLFGWDHIEK